MTKFRLAEGLKPLGEWKIDFEVHLSVFLFSVEHSFDNLQI